MWENMYEIMNQSCTMQDFFAREIPELRAAPLFYKCFRLAAKFGPDKLNLQAFVILMSDFL